MDFLTTSIWKTLQKFRVGSHNLSHAFCFTCVPLVEFHLCTSFFQILHVHLCKNDHVLKGNGQFQAVKIESWLVCMIASYLEVVFVLLLMDTYVLPYEHHICSCKCTRNTRRCVGSTKWVLSMAR